MGTYFLNSTKTVQYYLLQSTRREIYFLPLRTRVIFRPTTQQVTTQNRQSQSHHQPLPQILPSSFGHKNSVAIRMYVIRWLLFHFCRPLTQGSDRRQRNRNASCCCSICIITIIYNLPHSKLINVRQYLHKYHRSASLAGSPKSSKITPDFSPGYPIIVIRHLIFHTPND